LLKIDGSLGWRFVARGMKKELGINECHGFAEYVLNTRAVTPPTSRIVIRIRNGDDAYLDITTKSLLKKETSASRV
jgi:hypothetical protein